MEQKLLNTIYSHLNQNNFSDAFEILKNIKNTHINDAGFWEILALAHGMSGNNEEFKNACLHAIELNPNNIGTHINLGVAQQDLGLFDEAEKTLKKAITMNSEHPQVQNNLGALYIIQSDFSKAKPYVEKAIAINPDYSEAHCNLAEIYKNNHENDKAVRSFLKSIELNVSSVNAYVGLGKLYNVEGKFDEAEKYLSKAVELNPHHTEAIFNLGFLYYLKKSFEAASRYFKRVIELDPNHYNAAYLLSAITGDKVPEQSPELYVKRLFDHYADTFDEHLVGDLGYSVPETMYSVFTDIAKPVKTETILDLGCGTGMCGELFKNDFSYITGIDLSENMVAKTKEKNIYDELYCIEISRFLISGKLKYDLVIAADVFIYIGNITELIQEIYNRQNDNGYFIFSIEKSSKHKSFHLRNTGRYSHNKEYVNMTLRDSCYTIISTVETIIRNEKGVDIVGLIYLCQK